MRFIILFLLSVIVPFTASATSQGKIQLDYNFQRPGGDYSNFRVDSARECASKCELSRRCQAFDFHRSDYSCWLKERIGPSRPYQGVISGIKKYSSREQLPSKPQGLPPDIVLNRDTQRPGGDYTSFRSSSARKCARECSMQSRCVAFDYTTSDSYCYLKSWKPPSRGYNGIISGVKIRNSPQVEFAQKVLQQQYYNPGPADGVMGRRTILALKYYQKDHGLPVTGTLDEATLESMRRYRANEPSAGGMDYSEDELLEDQEVQPESWGATGNTQDPRDHSQVAQPHETEERVFGEPEKEPHGEQSTHESTPQSYDGSGPAPISRP